MRLIELEIENVRGITHLKLKPDGKNFVIWGPHIDHEPKDAVVRAILKLSGITDSIEIKRCMSKNRVLECEDSMKLILEPVLSLASRGQHILTRREILKYITSDGSTRAREIQDLLNITEIDKIRKALVKVENDLKKERDAVGNAIETAKGATNATIQEKGFQESKVLEFINKARKILGGKEISSILSKELKIGLTPTSTILKENAVNVTLFERDIQNLQKTTVEEYQTDIKVKDEQLREVITTIRSDPELLRSFNRYRLIELGISMIDDIGNCPLCDTSWPEEKLREYLEKKMSNIKIVAQNREMISKLSNDILTQVNITRGSLNNIIDVIRKTGNDEQCKKLTVWSSDLIRLSNALSDAIEKYPSSDFNAIIEPDGAALNFEVDFYGRGTYSPHALHSEGHQDSMGLCLYLALSERLAKGLIDLIILDDVVMSVDSNHRRDICRILASSFPSRQFLITTHDKTWANQMKSEGVVDRNSMIEFYNWNVDTGPQVNYQVDLWDKIEDDLKKNDIPNAAARLRRGLEEYFGSVCDSLQVAVKYKLNGQMELGDFTIPLLNEYRDLIKKAKKSASSWGNNENKELYGGESKWLSN